MVLEAGSPKFRSQQGLPSSEASKDELSLSSSLVQPLRSLVYRASLQSLPYSSHGALPVCYESNIPSCKDAVTGLGPTLIQFHLTLI